ncbi:MAG: OmpA family protein [Rubrivivax sp.]|nr:OmpA family protein [Rubrivivax sp.]
MDPTLAHDARRRHLAVLLSAAAAGLAGCASVATAPPRDAPKAPVDSPPAAATPLAIERQWLQQWFEGTPVRIAQGADGALTVEVPREFCFDAGRSTVKPALAAVLDKVAESLRRVSQARLVLVAAPQDGDAASPLAQQRGAAMRRHLMTRGVLSSRIAAPAAAEGAVVQLRVDLPAG